MFFNKNIRVGKTVVLSWQESVQNFSAWHNAAHRLLDNLQAAVQIGHAETDTFGRWVKIASPTLKMLESKCAGSKDTLLYAFCSIVNFLLCVHFFIFSGLLSNLQCAGASQHAQLQLLLLQRSAADKAYAQAGRDCQWNHPSCDAQCRPWCVFQIRTQRQCEATLLMVWWEFRPSNFPKFLVEQTFSFLILNLPLDLWIISFQAVTGCNGGLHYCFSAPHRLHSQGWRNHIRKARSDVLLIVQWLNVNVYAKTQSGQG